MDLATKIIALLAVIIAVLTILNSLLRKNSSIPRDFPYKKIEHLLNTQESSVLRSLLKILGSDIEVFVKVNLSRLVTISGNSKNTISHLRRLRSHNIDFVLCNNVNHSLLMAIQIDRAKDRESRKYDELIQILNSANIKFIILQSNRIYDNHELSSLLRQAIGPVGEVAINA